MYNTPYTGRTIRLTKIKVKRTTYSIQKQMNYHSKTKIDEVIGCTLNTRMGRNGTKYMLVKINSMNENTTKFVAWHGEIMAMGKWLHVRVIRAITKRSVMLDVNDFDEFDYASNDNDHVCMYACMFVIFVFSHQYALFDGIDFRFVFHSTEENMWLQITSMITSSTMPTSSLLDDIV